MIDFTPLELQVIHTVLRLTNKQSPEPLPESSREWANAMRSVIKKIEANFTNKGVD